MKVSKPPPAEKDVIKSSTSVSRSFRREGLWDGSGQDAPMNYSFMKVTPSTSQSSLFTLVAASDQRLCVLSPRRHKHYVHVFTP